MISLIIITIPIRQKFLKECLISVTKQTRQPDEIIIINDKEGNGAAWARNKALQMATCDFVAFLDDDDYLKEDHLEKLEAVQHETNADVVYPMFMTEPPNCHPITQFDDADFKWPEDRYIFPITTLVRREAALAVAGFENDPNADTVAGEDYVFWNRLADAGYSFARCMDKTWVWRMHSSHHSGVNYKQHTHSVNWNAIT